MSNGKHTVYIDIDDEITAIIDKVKNAPEKIVALVLPKRATVLQSIVNMKLLKKSAQSSHKSLVLITSEAGLMPLAGAVGLHVAKSLQSKPVVPLAPDHGDSDDAVISEETGEAETDLDKSKSVGALATGNDVDDDTETIELDDMNVDDEAPVPGKTKKNFKQKFKVPNFDRFRLSFFLAILAVILLVVGWVFAAIIMPKATIVISTDTSTNVSNISFTANTETKDLDIEKKLVPAVQKEVKKTDTEKTTASGKKDNGTKASGSVTLSIACSNVSGTPPTIPAGTGVSSNGQTFITSDSTSLTTASFSPCKFSGTTAVVAQNAGTQYNLAAGLTFTVSGYSSVTGNNSAAMSGGTTSIVTVVSQEDIDTAVAKMKGRLDNDAKRELAALLSGESVKSLDETLLVSAPVITSTPALNTEATGEVTVSQETTYSILGVKQDYLSQMIKKDVEGKIDTSTQSILDDGLGSAPIRLDARKTATDVQMSLQALVVAGPQLDANSIKEEIKGKKRGDAEKIIKGKTGVKDVTISYKPFWVLSTPKSVKKITVTIEKPTVTKSITTTDVTNP